MKKTEVEQKFSRAAESYTEVADVQRVMAEAVTALIAGQGGAPRKVLEVGCGTGILSEQLLRTFPEIETLRLVDLSSEMLREAERRVRPTGKTALTWIREDGEHYPHPPECDLWVSGATVQWFADFPKMLRRLRSELPPYGRVAFSCFGPGTLRELYDSYAEVHGGERRRQAQFWDRDELTALVEQSGFRILGKSHGEWSAKEKDLVSLLKTIQRMGASNRPDPTSALTRSSLHRWSRRYAERFPAPGGGITATWEWFAAILSPV